MQAAIDARGVESWAQRPVNGLRVRRPGEGISPEFRQLRNRCHRTTRVHEKRGPGLTIASDVILLAIAECEPVQVRTHAQLGRVGVTCFRMNAPVVARQVNALESGDEIVLRVRAQGVIGTLVIQRE